MQWHESNPELKGTEINAMRAICPEATYGFFPDGHMYWQITLNMDVNGSAKRWVLLGVYNMRHPSKYFGESFRLYPVSPSSEEMLQMVQESDVEPKFIPHMIRDDEDNVLFSLEPPDGMWKHWSLRQGIFSAASYIGPVKRWISMFEHDLRDQEIWNRFQMHPMG